MHLYNIHVCSVCSEKRFELKLSCYLTHCIQKYLWTDSLRICDEAVMSFLSETVSKEQFVNPQVKSLV